MRVPVTRGGGRFGGGGAAGRACAPPVPLARPAPAAPPHAPSHAAPQVAPLPPEAVSETVPRTRVSAYAVLVDDGKLLLTRLSAASPVFAPGLWHLPGGGIAPGEQPTEALVREVDEETGGSTAEVARHPLSRLDEARLSPAAVDALTPTELRPTGAGARPQGAAPGPPASPGDGQCVHPVHRSVVLEREVVAVGGQPQGGDAPVQGAVDDL